MLGEVNGKARERERDHNGRGQRYRSAVCAWAFATEHTTGHNGRSDGVQFSGSSPPALWSQAQTFDVPDIFYLYHGVEALLRGGDERSAREELHRFAERAEVNERERVAYLRSLAVLSEFEGDQERAIAHLHEAHTQAQEIGLPKELWQIQSRIGELYKRRGEAEQAREAFSIAAQTLRMLAQKIEDEELREGFLSAPRVRRVLGRN